MLFLWFGFPPFRPFRFSFLPRFSLFIEGPDDPVLPQFPPGFAMNETDPLFCIFFVDFVHKYAVWSIKVWRTS